MQEIHHERFKNFFSIYKARWNWVSNYATEAKLHQNYAFKSRLLNYEPYCLLRHTAISIYVGRIKASSLQDKTEGEYGILMNDYQQN